MSGPGKCCAMAFGQFGQTLVQYTLEISMNKTVFFQLQMLTQETYLHVGPSCIFYFGFDKRYKAQVTDKEQ